MGNPKRENPQEPDAVPAEVQGGLDGPDALPTRITRYSAALGRAVDTLSHAHSGLEGGGYALLEGVQGSDQGSDRGALLGINGRTEASHGWRGFQPENLVEEVDPETGEILLFEVTAKGRRIYKTPPQLRAERYALKSVVNRMYPSSLTSKCARMKIPNKSVRILKTPEFQKAHYAGLTRCALVWRCPLCAAKIAERRRSELVAAVATARAMDWKVYLMTCTVPHGLGDDIAAMLDQMLNAWRRMTTGRAGKDVRKLLGIEGTIRTLEVTDGKNGFHPHFHVLLFAKTDFSPESFQAGFLPLWQDACVKSGLPCPSDIRGLRVDDGSWAARYATKWGLEDEMVRGHMKTSKGDKGMTPWDMLRDILMTRSKRSEARFRLYAEAFAGRRQLYWSNGLKAKLAVEEVSDKDAVERNDEHSLVLATLTDDQWRAVLATRSEAALLEVAETHPQDLPAILCAIEASHTGESGYSITLKRLNRLDFERRKP